MQKTLAKQPAVGENESSRPGVEAPKTALTTPAAKDSDDMADTDSSTGKAPAFQFYPKDFTEGTVDLSAEEVGAYIRLLCYQWGKGFVPSELGARARIVGVTRGRMMMVWAAIRRHFTEQSDGQFVNQRLERERQKQIEFRAAKSDAGKRGAEHRWQKDGSAIDSPLAKAIAKPMANDSSSSAFSDLQSSDFSQKEKEQARARGDSVSMRAGTFCEVTYPELYQKYRKGACYVGRPALDFQEALRLCATWDDERLVKIATVFLTTDHEFAENGSRTMAQFRSMASWCDGKLREKGL